MQDIRDDLCTGGLTIEDRDGQPCLCGGLLDACNDSGEAYEEAKRLVQALNDAFAAAIDCFEPVQMGSVLEILTDGTTRHHARLVGTIRGRARFRGTLVRAGAAPPTPEASLAERMMEAAKLEPYFAAALRSFATVPPTFASLFVAFETIKQRGDVGGNARKRGLAHMLAHGWATASALENFYETAHMHRHGKPNHPMKPGCREITVDEARELIRQLLVMWAQELVP